MTRQWGGLTCHQLSQQRLLLELVGAGALPQLGLFVFVQAVVCPFLCWWLLGNLHPG